MKETGLTFGRRETTLLILDQYLLAYNRSKNRLSGLSLDKAIQDYKKAVPGWQSSSRNRTGLMARTFHTVARECVPWMEQRGFMWSPLHTELTISNGARSCITGYNLFGTWQGGGEPLTDLSQMGIDSTLYIMAHGHGQMPAFKIDKTIWTPQQLTDELIKDGLRTEHRFITMLVCHAGESVNSKSAGERLLAIQQDNDAAKAQIATLSPRADAGNAGAASAVAALTARRAANGVAFAAITAGGSGYRHAEHWESLASQADQLLPMAAQLSAAMKAKGFNNFVLKSFKAPVVNIPKNGKLCLDLSYARANGDRRLTFPLPAGVDWDEVPAELVPDWVVEWR